MEIQYDSNGDGWEIGALYEFSDDGFVWHASILSGISFGSKCRYRAYSYLWDHIRICQTPVVAGKIHKKPVALIEGELYKFSFVYDPNRVEIVGRYSERHISGSGFKSIDGGWFNPEYCTNIKRMVEAEDD